jgi:hypothetical protein
MKTGFIMISTLLSTASASALAIIVSMPAQAGEIDVAGTTGSLTFAAAPGNTLEVSSDGFGGIANYMSGSPSSDSSGSATFFQINPPTGSFLTGTANAGSPPFFTPIPPANETFNYTATSGPADSLTADITWDTVISNTAIPGSEPQLHGTGVIRPGVTGDSTFTMDFPEGGGIDITANFFSPSGSFPCTLTDLAAGPPACAVTMQIASFEGGVVTPGGGGGPGGGGMMPPDLPEPMSSITTLGLALFCLWGTYQLTRRERRDHGVSA